MPKTDPDLQDDPSVQEDSQVNSRTRIDRAHVVANGEAEEAGGEPEAGETPREALAGDDCELAAEQLRGQADQLAAYLRSRQRGLDQRESRLNARLAQLDASARNTRMTLNQQQAELAQRESALAEQEQEVETRLARLASTEAVADRLRDQLTEDRIRHEEMQEEMDAERTTLAAVRNEQAGKEDALRHERQQIDRHREASLQLIRQLTAGLERRRKAIEARADDLTRQAGDPDPRLLEREAEVRETAETFKSRRRQLELSETLLAEARAETKRLREQLILDRQKVQQEAQADSEQAAARHRRAAMELEKKRNSLRRRSEHVDRSRAALLKLRSELGHMQRETLEIRMATEELWIQMSGTPTPGALSRSLERIRAQLADQYRTAATELAEQKRELHAIRAELSRQHEQLLERKQELEGWAKRREEEIQRQTARLAAREEELGRRQTALDDLARQRHGEQLDYQTEIRQLRARLDESTCPPITA